MSIQYLPQGIPIVSSSFSVSSSHAIRANNENSINTAVLAGHGLNAVGPVGYTFITASATNLVETGSQGLTILVVSTSSLAFRMATSSFSIEYGSNVGPMEVSASYGGGPGYNPILNLERYKQYRFVIRGQPPTAVETKFKVYNNGSSQYTFDVGAVGPNPTLTLVRGYRYEFDINAPGHPFWLQTTNGAYDQPNLYLTGVYNSGSQSGTMVFIVPHSAPSTLYYVCQNHSSMRGTINIVDDGLYRFAIQTASGSYNAGTLFNTGVTNNNIKSGSLIFAVSASAPSTLYYASADSSVMRGTINIIG